jgi:hypothetical protein
VRRGFNASFSNAPRAASPPHQASRAEGTTAINIINGQHEATQALPWRKPKRVVPRLARQPLGGSGEVRWQRLSAHRLAGENSQRAATPSPAVTSTDARSTGTNSKVKRTSAPKPSQRRR